MSGPSIQYRVWLFLQRKGCPMSVPEIAAGCEMLPETISKALARLAERHGAVTNMQPHGRRGRWRVVQGVTLPNLQRGGNKGYHGRVNQPLRHYNAGAAFVVPPCELARIYGLVPPKQRRQATA